MMASRSGSVGLVGTKVGPNDPLNWFQGVAMAGTCPRLVACRNTAVVQR